MNRAVRRGRGRDVRREDSNFIIFEAYSTVLYGILYDTRATQFKFLKRIAKRL